MPPEILETVGLTKRFGGLVALDNVDVKVLRRTLTLLIGPNGAGKTTFVNVCTGVLKPDAGKVYFSPLDDERLDITGWPSHKIYSAGLVRTFQIPRPGKDKIGVLAIGFEETAALVLAAKAYPALSEVVWQGSDGTAGISQFLDPSIADFVVKTKMYNTMASPGVSPHADKVRDYIKQKLGMDPIGYAYFVYDIAWTLALALDAVGKYDPIAVHNALPLVLKHYIGASGYIELDENGDRSVADFDLWVVTPKDGTYVWKIARRKESQAISTLLW